MSTDVENFGSLCAPRLLQERKRLRLSQASAGQACGVSREMWGKYERGEAAPGGDVLLLFAKHGADVQFVLTGERHATASALVAEEKVPEPSRPDPEWLTVLELVADQLHQKGLVLPGKKLLRLVDLIWDNLRRDQEADREKMRRKIATLV